MNDVTKVQYIFSILSFIYLWRIINQMSPKTWLSPFIINCNVGSLSLTRTACEVDLHICHSWTYEMMFYHDMLINAPDSSYTSINHIMTGPAIENDKEQLFMRTPSNESISAFVALSKSSDAEIWCFLWSVPEQTVGLIIVMPVIWGAIALFMTSLWCFIITQSYWDILTCSFFQQMCFDD